MKLPTPVYEYLPSIYIIAGVLLAANFDNAIGKTVATILVFTGVIVFNMRLNSRSEHVRNARSPNKSR